LLAAIAVGAMLAPEASAAEFCRRDVTGHMTSCGFDTMAQCQAMSAGIGGDCFRDPFLNDEAFGADPANRRRPAADCVWFARA
jgi:hypothetical protein